MPTVRERRWWTDEEDEVLRARVQLQEDETGNVENWNEVAIMLPGRTNKDCRKRWSKVQAGIRKGPWTHEEDERLQKAVEQHGFKWALISRSVRTRNADQCAKRWQHVLGPGCKHSAWTTQEDQKLLAAIKKHGNNWKQIGLSDLPDRSSHDIRNRSVALARRGRRSSNLPSNLLQDENPTPTMGSVSTAIEDNHQELPASRNQDTSQLGENAGYFQNITSDMDIDHQGESPEPSMGLRAGQEPPSRPESREASQVIDMSETGTASSVSSMWEWPDFTTYPFLFDEQQPSVTPNTSQSSDFSQMEDAPPSKTASYSQPVFTSSDETYGILEQGIDFGTLNHDIAETTRGSHGQDARFTGGEAFLPFVSGVYQDVTCTTNAERKGHVTIILKQVDAIIAQDIMSSVLRYNDSLVIRLHLE